MSPDSQHLQAIDTRYFSAAFPRLPITAPYFASYSAGRMLSLIPPSTDTYVLTHSISLWEPISYIVMPASPTIDLPGSMQISGIGIFNSRTFSLVALIIASTYSLYGLGVSSFVYLIPNPPPKFMTLGLKSSLKFHFWTSPNNASTANKKLFSENICEPI